MTGKLKLKGEPMKNSSQFNWSKKDDKLMRRELFGKAVLMNSFVCMEAPTINTDEPGRPQRRQQNTMLARPFSLDGEGGRART